MNSLRILNTLGLAQLQDGGRFGVRHLGVTQGGALDWVAMRWANWLLGNAALACVLEIPYGGLTLLCEADTRLAITGADLDARLDGVPVRNWTRFDARAGQQLRFGQPVQGMRAYLAVTGGFQVEPILGANATVTREGLGGLDGHGSGLRAGDRLPFLPSVLTNETESDRQIPRSLHPRLSGRVTLDVVVGAQSRGFCGRSLFEAFNRPWRVDLRSDRMGARLLGPTLRYQGPGLISEGIPLGGIQVPPDGQPIVLLNDRQTIGGYPRLGALDPLSVARLAQCAPHQEVWLRAVGSDCARRRLLEMLALTEA